MIYRTANYKTIIEKRLSPIAKCILFLLYCFVNEEGVAFPSREKMLNCLGLSKNGYYKHFCQLEANGLLTVDRKKYRVNRYHPQWKRPAGKGKYGIVYKDLMVNPGISPIAKLLYTYITVFCPYNRSWNFKKALIIEELQISAYHLKKSLKELEYLHLITCDYKLYEVTITNTFQSESLKKRGLDPSKKEDTTLKKKEHDPSKKEDREENIIIETSSCLSSPNKNKGETKTDGEEQQELSELAFADAEIKEWQNIDCQKINSYYLRLLFKHDIKGWYASELSKILERHRMTLFQFAEQFLKRYEQKTAHVTVRSIHAYMKVCLGEFIGDYDLLSTEGQKKTEGYPATYDIAAYESTSVLDEEEGWSESIGRCEHTGSFHIQPTYDIAAYESTSVLDEFDFALECVGAGLEL